MKKRILGITLLAIVVMVAMLGTTVNAAKISATPTEINKGQQVKVTITANAESDGIQFDLNYKSEYFKLLDISSTGKKDNKTQAMTIMTNPEDLEDANGNINVMAYNASKYKTNTVTLTFEALKDTTAEGAEFKASGFVSGEEKTFDVDSVTVKVVTPQTPNKDDNKKDEGTQNTQNTNTNTNTQTSNKKENKTEVKDSKTTSTDADTDGKEEGKPDSLKQTGAPIYVGAIALIVVAGTVLAVRKSK